MALINLGQIDKNLIPIFVGCIICFLNRLLNQYKGTLLYKNIIITGIFISISRFLAVIPYIILRIKTKNLENIDNKSINKKMIKYIYTDNQKKIVRGKNVYIILTALIYLIQQMMFIATFEVKTNSWIWIILITSIFYYLIFKIKLYLHHVLSSILILLIGAIIDIILDNVINDINSHLVLLIIKFIRETLFSLYNVMAKYVMEKKFVSVYEFSFYIGTISLILLIILSIFDYAFFGIDDYKEYFNNFNGTEFLVMVGVIITQFGINLSSLFTVKNNSPCHTFIMFVFGQLAYYINLEGNSILVIICLILILFLSLIFNEIIEINFCGLSKNTRRNIMLRAETEENLYITKNDTIDSTNSDYDNLIELEVNTNNKKE